MSYGEGKGKKKNRTLKLPRTTQKSKMASGILNLFTLFNRIKLSQKGLKIVKKGENVRDITFVGVHLFPQNFPEKFLVNSDCTAFKLSSSLDGGGTLPKNIYKPSQDLYHATQ